MAKVKLDDLSALQLKFTEAGIKQSYVQWVKLEQQLSLAEQLQCLRYVSMEPNPLFKIKERIRTRDVSSRVPERQR